MRKRMWVMLVGLTTVTVWQLGGCDLLPLIPITIGTTTAPFATFDAQAGVPSSRKSTSTNIDTQGFTIGRGTFQLDPSLITIDSAGGATGKAAVAAQGMDCSSLVTSAFTACSDMGATSDECLTASQALAGCLVGNGELIVTVWTASIDDVDIVCDAGDHRDTYGPYVVSLDASLQTGVSVSPPTVDLTERTTGWINAGSISFCAQLSSPVDGTVTVQSITINLGL